MGPQGVVYAVDVSAAQIAATKTKLEAAGLYNVQYIVSSVENIDHAQYKPADMVYARWLLMHVQEPQKVIALMADLLKTGGVLSLDESDFFSATQSKGINPALKRYYELLIAYGKHKGFDYSVGSQLKEYCHRVGVFAKIDHYQTQHQTTSQVKKLLSYRVNEVQEKLIDAGLISPEEYAQLKADMLHHIQKAQSRDTILNRKDHILAWKN